MNSSFLFRLSVYLLVILSACHRDYPDGVSVPGQLSYREGNLVEWQHTFKDQFVHLLKIPNADLSAQTVSYKIVSFLKDDRDDQRLYKILKRNCIDFKIEKNHLVLQSLHKKVVVYKVEYAAKDQTPLSGFLLVPQISDPLLPSFLYVHGHGASADESGFDGTSYVKGVGFERALQGNLVFVPHVRGFAPGNAKEHIKLANELTQKGGELYLTKVALDAMTSQDLLEQLDLTQFGVDAKIDLQKNTIAGVSLGGNIALLAGALDNRFESVEVHGIFIGYEVLFSKYHHFCQHLPQLIGQANIMDSALLIPPRHLVLTFGAKDLYSNGYAKTAVQSLLTSLKKARYPFCIHNDPKAQWDFLESLQVDSDQRCEASHVEVYVDSRKGHEYIEP